MSCIRCLWSCQDVLKFPTKVWFLVVGRRLWLLLLNMVLCRNSASCWSVMLELWSSVSGVGDSCRSSSVMKHVTGGALVIVEKFFGSGLIIWMKPLTLSIQSSKLSSGSSSSPSVWKSGLPNRKKTATGSDLTAKNRTGGCGSHGSGSWPVAVLAFLHANANR